MLCGDVSYSQLPSGCGSAPLSWCGTTNSGADKEGDELPHRRLPLRHPPGSPNSGLRLLHPAESMAANLRPASANSRELLATNLLHNSQVNLEFLESTCIRN